MSAFQPGAPFALFDDGSGGARVFHGPAGRLDCTGPDGLDTFFLDIAGASAAGRWVVLAADFEAGYWLERRLQPLARAGGTLSALVFDSLSQLNAQETAAFLAARLADVPTHQRTAGVCDVRSDTGEEAFTAAVQRIQDYIAAGDCYQVNFTFGLDFLAYGHPLALYARLRQAQPVPYGAWVEFPDRQILSLSPELFLERSGSRLLSRPMKGTAPRGADGAEDAVLAAALVASAKERAENVMIVDLIRNDLGRLASPGSVVVERLCAVETYPTVFQMVSDVAADVPGAEFADIFRALFPCGSITGAPKIRAMQIIRELELAPRGLYTGALGWLAPDGDFRLNVAIRTLILQEGRGRLGIGAGIVADSDPTRELAECRSKARFLTGLQPGFQLIESLRLEAGNYPLLEMHLERLKASAASLGFALDVDRVRHELLEHAQGQPAGSHKTRLLLYADASLSLDSSPLGAPPAGPVGVVLAAEPLDSRDPLLRHKTTARGLYDAELARLAPGVFDALFLNERGELCEGARSNLFVQRNGRLYTPPLASGLLGGVMRNKLLMEGRAEERVLYLQDLEQAQGIYISNAVRGLLPALLVL